MPDSSPTDLSMRERKQLRVRESIIDAAYALFEEHGFPDVTVSDIARRADVGRTTFFRYFGDKQEVLFADEQNYMDLLTRKHANEDQAVIENVGQAVAFVKVIVLQVCDFAVLDPHRFEVHYRLVEQNFELLDRMNRKLDRYADVVANILIARGLDEGDATLAAHLSLACYRSGLLRARRTTTPLPVAVNEAFDQLSNLGHNEVNDAPRERRGVRP